RLLVEQQGAAEAAAAEAAGSSAATEAGVAAEAAASELVGRADQRRGLGGAETDGVNANATCPGLLGGRNGLYPLSIGAVGEHNNGVRLVPGRRARVVLGPFEHDAGRRHVGVVLGDGVEGGQDRLADGCAAGGGEGVKRGKELLLVAGRLDEQ